MTTIENALSKNITAAGDESQYDDACKRLLSNKTILAWIMKNCLTEYQGLSIEEIAQNCFAEEPQVGKYTVHQDEAPFHKKRKNKNGERIESAATEDSTIQEGVVHYDIRFHAKVPSTHETINLIINCEAQGEKSPGYPLIKRALYYCSRMISAQKETIFTGSDYGKINKVVSVWVCLNPPEKIHNTITKYRIIEENMVGNAKEIPENYDLLTAVMVCLGNPNEENYEGLLKMLEVLLSNRREPQEKKKVLEEEFHIEMTKDMEEEVHNMSHLGQGIKENGIAIGLEQGMERGAIAATLRSIKTLMETVPTTAEQAMKLLRISESEMPQYAHMLQKQ
jgi:hypothetical protein